MMTQSEFDTCLADLDLTQSELARLLGVSARTVRRWAENTAEMPGPATQALRAWQRLKGFKLSWRPDSKALGDEKGLSAMIDNYRKQDYEIVASALERVAAIGGPKTPWQVDLEAGEARLGEMTVQFYENADRGFTPMTYRWPRRDLDTERDCQLIDDAYACIQEAITKRDQKLKSSRTSR